MMNNFMVCATDTSPTSLDTITSESQGMREKARMEGRQTAEKLERIKKSLADVVKHI